MKKIFIAFMALATLVSCSKVEIETPSTPELPDPTAPIQLSAGIEANTTVNSRAAVAGTTFPANTNNVFYLTAYSGAVAPTTTYETTYFANEPVNSGVASALTLATPQYYPADGSKNLFFYAYAPVATSVTAGNGSTAPIANYIITGQEDIMAAQVVDGIAKVSAGVTQTQPDFAFAHKLKQVQFEVKKDATFEDNINVTSIKVKEAKTSAKLNVITGVLEFEATTGNLTAYTDGNGVTLTTSDATIPGSIMFEPGTDFKLTIVAGDVTYDDIAVTLTGTDAGNAGMSHTVTLTFKRSGVTPTATIDTWANGTGADVDVQ